MWRKASNLSTLLFFGGFVALSVVIVLVFGVVASAIVILSFSAFFAAYLAEFYTTSFNIATFAKSTSMLLFFAGTIMLFVAVGWWGLAGIAGHWLLFTLSRVFWHKRLERYLDT